MANSMWKIEYGDWFDKFDEKHFEKPPRNIFEFVSYLSKKCFMPLSFGGGLNNIDQIQKVLSSSADKFVVNTAAFEDPNLISKMYLKLARHCSFNRLSEGWG